MPEKGVQCQAVYQAVWGRLQEPGQWGWNHLFSLESMRVRRGEQGDSFLPCCHHCPFLPLSGFHPGKELAMSQATGLAPQLPWDAQPPDCLLWIAESYLARALFCQKFDFCWPFKKLSKCCVLNLSTSC